MHKSDPFKPLTCEARLHGDAAQDGRILHLKSYLSILILLSNSKDTGLSLEVQAFFLVSTMPTIEEVLVLTTVSHAS